MKELVEKFTQQLQEAVAIGKQAKLSAAVHPIRNVLITGLGGSGIGGTIISEIVSAVCPVPITVNKDYFLPSFVDQHTLVIVSSYSGNTEETLQAFQTAIEKNAKIVCVTSGGKIAEIAKSKNLDTIMIPGGMPPRSCLGYSLSQLFFIFKFFGLTDGRFVEDLNTSIVLLDAQKDAIHQEAKAMADFLFMKLPVIYAVDGYNGVATRFRQQINENSKMLCWHHILPEMNHNELVGWAEKHDDLAVVLLRNKSDFDRTQARIEISKQVFLKYTPHVKEIWSQGSTHLQMSLYHIHLTDWISVYLAEKKKIDANEVHIIDHLKGELSKI